jgi:glutamate dehydrogenase/leucine dehydrogenase
MSVNELLSLSPDAFVRWLRERNISRFRFVYDEAARTLKSSHPELQPVAEALAADRRDFLAHEGLFFQVTREHPTLQGAFVHRTCRGQAAGGVRWWHYDTLEDYLRDGLRLAVGMTRKNALAGLWWGGGKGVMARSAEVDASQPAVRASLYRAYGELMTSLKGCYVTAEDVGTHVSDMAQVFQRTRFTTCIPPELGGSGNPSVPTARGVVAGMEAALAFLEKSDLRGKTVAIQGVGNVGGPLVGFLFERGVARVVASDIDPRNVERVRQHNPGRALDVRAVARDDVSIFSEPCDVFAPCATGAILNPRTIPLLKARIVCGAANNQLEDPERDDRALHARGILYVPDFLTNRMGIVTCADEQAGYVPADPLIERHLSRDWAHSIHRTTLQVLETSRSTGAPPSQVATEIADRLSLEPNPIFGHRGKQIIAGLVEERWHERG